MYDRGELIERLEDVLEALDGMYTKRIKAAQGEARDGA